jgi:signal peptidase I
MLNFIKRHFLQLVISLTFLVIISHLFLRIVPISGVSMVPTLQSGNLVLSERLSYMFRNPEKGDIIILKRNSSYLVKRVIAKPGDKFKISDCSVIFDINGVRFTYSEPYLDVNCFEGGNSIRNGRIYVVPENKYLVLGDNRLESVDSRAFGFIDAQDIIGRVYFIIYPFSTLGYI